MKINKERLNALTDMSDEMLWKTVREIATSHGYSLPERAPSHSEMEKLRAAMRGGDKINMADAVKLLKNYKKS